VENLVFALSVIIPHHMHKIAVCGDSVCAKMVRVQNSANARSNTKLRSRVCSLTKALELRTLKRPPIIDIACSLNRDGGMGAVNGPVWANTKNLNAEQVSLCTDGNRLAQERGKSYCIGARWPVTCVEPEGRSTEDRYDRDAFHTLFIVLRAMFHSTRPSQP
jgi:hypothetical protein